MGWEYKEKMRWKYLLFNTKSVFIVFWQYTWMFKIKEMLKCETYFHFVWLKWSGFTCYLPVIAETFFDSLSHNYPFKFLHILCWLMSVSFIFCDGLFWWLKLGFSYVNIRYLLKSFYYISDPYQIVFYIYNTINICFG